MQSNILHKHKGTKQILRLTACSQRFVKSLRDFVNTRDVRRNTHLRRFKRFKMPIQLK